jgi:hypothetical protein
LIGFIKLVTMGEIAGILQLLCKNAHHDKRPANALIAKAIELCSQNGISYLTYGQYIYDNKTDSPLTTFKRRNGFVEMRFPRYYVPLTAKGRFALQTRLHLGIKRFLPKSIRNMALNMRSAWYERKSMSQHTDATELE